MTTRTPSPAKWRRSHLSSAGVWRTSWRAPAPLAFPQPTTPAPFPGINPVPASPAPALTTTTVPSTELAADFLPSASIVQYAYQAQYGCIVLCCTHTGPAMAMVPVPIGVSTGIRSSSVCSLYVTSVMMTFLPATLAVPNTVYRCLCWYMVAFLAQFSIWSKLDCTPNVMGKHSVPFQYVYSTVQLHCGKKTYQLSFQSIYTHSTEAGSKLNCHLSMFSWSNAPDKNLRTKTKLYKHTRHRILLDCKGVILLWLKWSFVSSIVYWCSCAPCSCVLCVSSIHVCFMLYMWRIRPLPQYFLKSMHTDQFWGLKYIYFLNRYK